jgi:hypothetical protein
MCDPKGNRHEHNSARNTSNKNNRQDAGKVERNRLSNSSIKMDLLKLSAMDADNPSAALLGSDDLPLDVCSLEHLFERLCCVVSHSVSYIFLLPS